MAGFVAVIYPLLWWIGPADHDLRDPLGPRLVVVSAALVVALGSRWSEGIRRRLGAWVLAVVYLAVAHTLWFLFANDLHHWSVVGVFVLLGAFVATSAQTIRTERQLFTFVLATGVGVVVAALGVDQPHISPSFVILMTWAVLVLAFVGVRFQLRTLEGLARSEEALRTDIVRRQEVEDTLRASQAETRGLLRAIPDVLLRVSATGKLASVSSPEGSPLAAYFQQQVGARLDDLLTGTRSKLDAALREGGTQTLHTPLHLGASTHHLEIRVTPSGPAELLVLVRDVTREHIAEEEMRRAGRMVALGTLASGVSHEVNNPLAYVVANVDFVRSELRARGVSAELIDPLTEALEGATRIRDIVSGMREKTHGDEIPLGQVDVNAAALAAIRLTKEILRSRVELETDLLATGPASANEPRLVQVIVSLLTNAAQAFPNRAMEQNRLVVRSGASGSEVVLEVQDNGVGIPPEALGRVFDAFYTTREPRDGTGLGLYLCQTHVRQMGGRIEVESAVGAGTTFRVHLPAAVVTPAPPTRLSPVDPPPRPRRRVLVVDDEPHVARALSRLLSPDETVSARDGNEGLRLCAEGPFDVILCDILMPGLDGIGFYERLSESHPELARRVIFITGGVFTDRAKAFLVTHTGRWLEKPLDLDRLLAMMDRVVA